jgi:RNA polymerase sigma-B factor
MAARSSGALASVALVPAPPGAAGWTVQEDLTGLDDPALLSLVHSLAQGAAARELLVTRYQRLVWSCVRPYLRSPVPAEDLMQVGHVGLLKAIGNFDPVAGASLAAYARPCISGEIKRYFRDKRWQLRVPRPVQGLVLQVRDATGPLAQQLGRTPTDSDLARHLGVSVDELRQARVAELAFESSSLDAPLAGQSGMVTLGDALGQDDPQLEHMLSMRAVAAHWGELPSREQQILIMDFGDSMTQAQIGQRLGISQMHVSRLRARALGYLRARLLDLEPHAAPGLPAVERALRPAAAGRVIPFPRRTAPDPGGEHQRLLEA